MPDVVNPAHDPDDPFDDLGEFCTGCGAGFDEHHADDCPFIDDDDDDDDGDDGDDDLADEGEWDMTPEDTVAVLERAIGEGASFLQGSRIVLPTGELRCRVCGCSENRACPGGCFWVAPNLCSRCLA